MDLNSAITTEGPLQKQSPGIIKMFQDRYFAIRGKGQFLVWFKKKPRNPDSNPKGIINIDTINEVRESESDDRTFEVQYLERTFTLRAETSAVRDRWVKALKTIISYHRKLNKNRKKQLETATESWKWSKDSHHDISEQIRLENEEAILQDDGSHKVERSQGILAHLTLDESLFDIQKCLFYGFYNKKGLITSSQRWFFLASEVNLKDEKEEEFYNHTQSFFDNLEQKRQGEEHQNQNKNKILKKVGDSDSSEDEEENSKRKRETEKGNKKLKVNVLYEVDEESRQVKYKYALADMVSFELKTTEQPFELKFIYEETVNEEEQEIKQCELILISDYLSEIRRLETALKIINDKFSLQKNREIRNANKSRKYPIKKWKFSDEEGWRLPGEKSTFPVMVNQKQIRLNANFINLESITDHKRQQITATEEEDKQKEKGKKQYAYAICFLAAEEKARKVLMQFEKPEIETKFHKRVQKNVKKKKEQIEESYAVRTGTAKEQEKKINPDTYLIEKKIRETHSSIKVNFYELMDREVIPEKSDDPNNGKDKGLWHSFMGMFCGQTSTHDLY